MRTSGMMPYITPRQIATESSTTPKSVMNTMRRRILLGRLSRRARRRWRSRQHHKHQSKNDRAACPVRHHAVIDCFLSLKSEAAILNNPTGNEKAQSTRSAHPASFYGLVL